MEATTETRVEVEFYFKRVHPRRFWDRQRLNGAEGELPWELAVEHRLHSPRCYLQFQGRDELVVLLYLAEHGVRPNLWVAVKHPFRTKSRRLDAAGSEGIRILPLPRSAAIIDRRGWDGRLKLAFTNSGPDDYRN